jgi:hypothetical protein
MPEPPYSLSILKRTKDERGADQIKTVQLNNADAEEVGHLASHLSRDNDWFIVIMDRTGKRQGAFLEGEYIESTTTEDEMIALAELWQSTNPARD